MGPTPTHYHHLETPSRRTRVVHEGRVLADSEQAISLREVALRVLEPVLYFPPADVDLSALEALSKRTFCPIKGHATYWSLRDLADAEEAIAWSYEDPIEYSRPIAGHVAFDPRRVTVELGPIKES